MNRENPTEETQTRRQCVASGHPGGGTIEIHEGSVTGTLLDACAVPSTGGWDNYQTVICPLKNKSGTNDLCMTFKGGAGELMRLEWLKFLSESRTQ